MEKSTEQRIKETEDKILYLSYDVKYLPTKEERERAKESLNFYKCVLDQLIQRQEDEWEFLD